LIEKKQGKNAKDQTAHPNKKFRVAADGGKGGDQIRDERGMIGIAQIKMLAPIPVIGLVGRELKVVDKEKANQKKKKNRQTDQQFFLLKKNFVFHEVHLKNQWKDYFERFAKFRPLFVLFEKGFQLIFCQKFFRLSGNCFLVFEIFAKVGAGFIQNPFRLCFTAIIVGACFEMGAIQTAMQIRTAPRAWGLSADKNFGRNFFFTLMTDFHFILVSFSD